MQRLRQVLQVQEALLESGLGCLGHFLPNLLLLAPVESAEDFAGVGVHRVHAVAEDPGVGVEGRAELLPCTLARGGPYVDGYMYAETPTGRPG